jgi:hypothetical protein
MLTRQHQAQQLRAVLVPYIESNGVEREVERRDGTKRRYREARLGGFVFCYKTPFHRNPRPIASCWDEALYLQVNPIEDYVLIVDFLNRPDDPEKGKLTTMFSACWRSKGDMIYISSFASNESGWYDIIFVVVELATKAARFERARPLSSDTSGQADTMPAVSLPHSRDER